MTITGTMGEARTRSSESGHKKTGMKIIAQPRTTMGIEIMMAMAFVRFFESPSNLFFEIEKWSNIIIEICIACCWVKK
jgi:hypothetical protein